jgi:hypothetical protein
MKFSRRGLLGLLGVLPFVGKKKAEARAVVPLPSASSWSQPNRIGSFPASEWISLKNITPHVLDKGDVVQFSRRGDAAVRPTNYSKARYAVSLERVEPGEYGRFATYGLTYAKCYTAAESNFKFKSFSARS